MEPRQTRRGQAETATGGAGSAAEADDGAEGGWKAEMESIMAGTHPTLLESLKKHEQTKNAQIAQADRIRQLQTININNLFEFEKKQADDESKAMLLLFQSRLIDNIQEKQKKAARQQYGGLALSDKQPVKRRRIGGLDGLPQGYTLKPEEISADVAEITSGVEHYSVRNAAVNEDLRGSLSGDAWYDKQKQLLVASGQTFERGATVSVYQNGTRLMDDPWTITQMNTVEVTLRSVDSQKHKVTINQLRNGRVSFRPA